MPQGACCARKRHAKDGPGENRFTTWSFKPFRTHVSTFSAPGYARLALAEPHRARLRVARVRAAALRAVVVHLAVAHGAADEVHGGAPLLRCSKHLLEVEAPEA